MIIRSKAPHRISFGGGGTDLNTYCDKFGGHVLNSTISLYANCTISPTNTQTICFRSMDTNEEVKLATSKSLELNGKMDLYKQIYNRIVNDYTLEPLSFNMMTYSDVPLGTGLGGSSTLIVSIIKAYTAWLDLPLGQNDIARLAFDIEREDLGIVGGAQDQYAATFGGFNFIEFEANKKVTVNPLCIKEWIIDELKASIVLYFTNISREASLIEKEKKSIMTKKSSLEAMHRVKEHSMVMKEVLLKGDINAFAKILGKSWQDKKQVSKSISTIEIDRIYDIAMSNGAYCGKVSGAGGGGFMFFMVDPNQKPTLIRALDNEQGSVFNFEFVSEGTKGWKIYE